MSNSKWNTNDIPDLNGKVFIVTGGNSGLGYESVKVFARHGATVVLASRTVDKGEQARKKILIETPGSKIAVMPLDISDLSSIRAFETDFKLKYNRLDVLLNNAGIMTTPYFLTKDGFEGQVGTNHLGHFALTGLLLEMLIKTPLSRVVNVSSMAHKQGTMDFENLLYENGKGYNPMNAYGRSKLANLLFTYELQRKFSEKKIDSIAVAAHPGVSKTNLARYIEDKLLFKILYPLFSHFFQDAAQGALPQIRASVDPGVEGAAYYGPDGFRELKGNPVLVKSNKASHSLSDARMLWEISETLTKVKYFDR
jgi:NAD(P)-dependent dehydrogenase (short-subunit alcohol dehydrogenase family)